MSDCDDLCAIIDLLDPRHCARRSGGSLMLSVREVATRMAAAGRRTPASMIETEEELNSLPVGTVLVEGDHATPDEVVSLGLATMPGVFHRFPDGWHVVAGYGPRQVPLPATVLWEPEES